MTKRILSVLNRMKLLKEINRVHRQIYGWNLLYGNFWKGIFIDTDNNTWIGRDKHGPMSRYEAINRYFYDDADMEMTHHRGLFAWEAYYLHHVNPFFPYYTSELKGEDFDFEGWKKRIGTDTSHKVESLTSFLRVNQRRDDKTIWITSELIFSPNFNEGRSVWEKAISDTLVEAVGGDKGEYEKLKRRYEEIDGANYCEFGLALERYAKGRKMSAKHWNGGYVFAASREWRIKTIEQLNEAVKVEEEHFSNVLEEFVLWLKSRGLNLGGSAEEGLRRRIREIYISHPQKMAKEWCDLLLAEDKINPSDVYLWWGGEPGKGGKYALLTLSFELSPEDIGTTTFDEKVSMNLRAIIDIIEKERVHLSIYYEYEPDVWSAFFS